MKVGILNCQHIDNYGAVLVAYSLQKALEQMGYSAEIIDYVPTDVEKYKEEVKTNSIEHYVKKLINDGVIKIIKRRMEARKVKSPIQLKYLDHNKYQNWRKQNLNYSKQKYDENSIVTGYDVVIEGSDVVWKPQRILGMESNLFLLKNIQRGTFRMTYAASIGTNDEDELQKVKKCLSVNLANYDRISVRESSSRQFVESCGGMSVEVVIDPTMLLKCEDYEKLIGETEEQPYIFMYTMGINEEAIKFVNLMSKKLNCGVIHPNIYYVNKKVKRTIRTYEEADPNDFLSYIKNAKLVVTNSFHGTVFSLIFHTPFYTFGRGMINVRMTDLLKKFEIEDRFLTKSYYPGENYAEIDFDRTDKIMSVERQRGLNYLGQALNEASKRNF